MAGGVGQYGGIWQAYNGPCCGIYLQEGLQKQLVNAILCERISVVGNNVMCSAMRCMVRLSEKWG
jgi:hypothetical protein